MQGRSSQGASFRCYGYLTACASCDWMNCCVDVRWCFLGSGPLPNVCPIFDICLVHKFRFRRPTNVRVFCVTQLLRICCDVWKPTSKWIFSFQTRTNKCCFVVWLTSSDRSIWSTSTQRNVRWFSVETTW